MSQYDPRAIHRMAALLNGAATIMLAVFILAAATTALAMGSFIGDIVGGPISVVAGIVYFSTIAGVGYLISLVLRVIAQLMLAVVKIELNTSAGLDAQAAAVVQDEVSRIAVAALDEAAMFCPRCGAEYRSGLEECADCHVGLVSEPEAFVPPAVSSDSASVMLCPGCGAEYRPGARMCSDCHVALVPGA